MNVALDLLRRPLLLALIAANILYFLWNAFVAPLPEGVLPWRQPGAVDARRAVVPAGVEPVWLAGEVDPAARQDPHVESASTTCFAVGPFNSRAASDAAAAFLRARDYAPELLYPADAAPEQTAVLIDGLPTRADQQRVVRLLLAAGWRDVAALEPQKSGTDELTAVYPISLGVFKAATGAAQRAADARRLGLAPTLVSRHANDAEHWLRIRSGVPVATRGDVRRLGGGRGWRVTDCETIG